MSSYPTPSDYQEALQAPAVAFADPDLQTATPRTNALGLPQPITGSFAAVFPVTTETGARYAVKCFLTEEPAQQDRYEAVADALNAIDHDAFVEFAYQPEGIQVRGEGYPILKMAWAEGTTLNRFVEKHLDRPEVLDRLATAWADLIADLEGMDLAHGDLQHGNVLVETAGEAPRLRLVDYDTMYVPALECRTSAEVGHRNYQHPDRTDADFGPPIDRFAGLVIYTALRACTVRPNLWAEYDTGENLLFRDADLIAPEDPSLFDALAEVESVSDLADALRTACYLESADVPSLEAVRDGKLDASRTSISRSRARKGRDAAERDAFAQAFMPATVAVCLSALVFAILSTRPKITEGKFTREDIKNKRSNLLFFGNFYNMELDDFHWGMMEMIKDSDFLYSSMTRDLYFLGIVLAKKYKYLRICYSIFMYGLIISVIAFGIAFTWQTTPQ